MGQSIRSRRRCVGLEAGPRDGFTFVEVLMVAIIVTVMAVTIVPQFSSSSTDAKMSVLKFNLRSIRSQLEKYKEQHGGAYPPAACSADFAEQMTRRTDPTTRLNANGACGPYLEVGIPVNPFNNSASVAIVEGSVPPKGPTNGKEGWQYNPAQGWFYPNDREFYRDTSGKN